MFAVPLELERRLQQRYQQLVTEQMSPAQIVAAGLRALPSATTALAATQAAYRFYSNDRVTLPALAQPLIDAARTAIEREGLRYALVVHDWSEINYQSHASKADRITIKSKHALGYSLNTALLVSDRDGAPIAPLAVSLFAKDGVHTTRSTQRDSTDLSNLDDVLATATHTATLGLSVPRVHIIDRAGDSVDHFRQLEQACELYLVRAKASPRVEFNGEQMALGEVVKHLDFVCGEAVAISPTLVGQQLVAEAEVVITRKGVKKRQRDGTKQKRTLMAGEPVRLRLIVSRIVLPDEQVHAEWLLLTNVGSEVSAEQIAQWYVWRWKIESYFKLLKSAGHHLEEWQQESAEAISRRVLVTAMGAVVVWKLARAEGAEAEATRQLLVRLSGRQMRRDRPVTEPAMLDGLWKLLAMLEILERYTPEDLRAIASSILPGFSRYDSG